MRNKVVKRIIFVLTFVVFIFGENRLLTYITMDNISSYTRITLHELYNSTDNIDVLFLGSSHCMRTFDCALGDERLGMNTFNAGTSSQFLDGSYALLVEAGKRNEIKEVWVELYYGQLGRLNEERTELTSTYAISDYMNLSLNKIRYLLEASTPEYWANSFIPARRYWETAMNINYISDLLRRKSQKEYRDYSYTYVNSYMGKGFVASDVAVEPGTYVYQNDFYPIKTMTVDDNKYLSRIITYCNKNNIKINFFSAPMSDFRLVSLGNYDDYVNEITTYLEGYGCKYYDFNLCKPEYLDLSESHFMDDNHLNRKGAELVTNLICDIMQDDINVKNLFYTSYSAKINAQDNRIYGVQLYSVTNNDGSNTYTIKTVQNVEGSCSYYIEKIINGTDKIILQEEGKRGVFTIPADENGIIHIVVYRNGEVTNNVESKF